MVREGGWRDCTMMGRPFKPAVIDVVTTMSPTAISQAIRTFSDVLSVGGDRSPPESLGEYCTAGGIAKITVLHTSEPHAIRAGTVDHQSGA